MTDVREIRPSGTLYRQRLRTSDPAWYAMELVAEIKEYDTDPSGRLLAHARFEYTTASGASTGGRIALQQQRIQPRDDPNGAEWASVRFEYDDRGNLEARTELGDLTTSEDDRTTRFCYDGDPGCADGQRSHSILVGIQDPLESWTRFEPGPSLSHPEVMRSDYVDQPTQLLAYDPFGRLVTLWAVPEGESDAKALRLQDIEYQDNALPSPRRVVTRYADEGQVNATWRALQEDGFGGTWKESRSVDGGRFSGSARFRDPVSATIHSTYETACIDSVSALPDPSCKAISNGATGVTTRLDPLGRPISIATPEGLRVRQYSGATDHEQGGIAVDRVLEKSPKGDLNEFWLDGERRILVRECGHSVPPATSDLLVESCEPDPSIGPAETRYAFEPTGEIKTLWDAIATAPSGSRLDTAHRIDYAYDTQGRIIRSQDPNAGTTTTTYDLFGFLSTTASSRLNSTLQYRFDALGRPTQIGRPDGGLAFLYRSRHRQIGVEIGPGYSIRIDYDPLGRVRRTRHSTEPQLVTSYERDLLGRTTQIEYPIAIQDVPTRTRYEYEGSYLKRICDLGTGTSCDPSGDPAQVYVRDIEYDDIGRRARMVLPGGERSFAYDPSSQRLTRDRFDGSTASGFWLESLYRDGGSDAAPGEALYDENGNLLEIRGTGSESSPDFHARFEYDNRNRLSRWIREVGGASTTLPFEYDHLGNLLNHAGDTSQTYLPARPHAIESRLNGAVRYAYDEAGQVKRIERPGSSRHFSFDSMGRLHCVGRLESGCDVLRVEYDAAGNRIREQAEDGRKRFFSGSDFVWTRDGSGSNGFARIEVFAFGERLAFKRVDGGALRRAADDDGGIPALLWIAPAALLFLALALGIPIPRGGRRVRTCSRPGRLGWTVIAIVVLLPPRGSHAGGGGAPAAGTALYRWVLSDQIGSGIAVVDEAGFRVNQMVFSPFGSVDGVETPGSHPGQRYFAGHAIQEETGLYFMNARWYDSESGRFLSPDPLLDLRSPQAHNAYSYVWNNPVNATDPTGEFCTPLGGTCFGSTVGSGMGFSSLNRMGFDAGEDGQSIVPLLNAGRIGGGTYGDPGLQEGGHDPEPVLGESEDLFVGVEALPVIATPDEISSAAFELLLMNQHIPRVLIDALPLEMVSDFAEARLSMMITNPPARETDRVFHDAEVSLARNRLRMARLSIAIAVGSSGAQTAMHAMPFRGLPKKLGMLSVGLLSQLYRPESDAAGAIVSEIFHRGVVELRDIAATRAPIQNRY